MKKYVAKWAMGLLVSVVGMQLAIAATNYPPLPGASSQGSTVPNLAADASFQAQAHASAQAVAKQQAEGEKQLKAAAFQHMLNQYFPLTPSQIHEFKNRAAEQQKANAQPPGPAPARGTSNIVTVSLKPGSSMPVIRIGQGMITSLVFIDAAGDVWPIESYSIGDPSAFNVNWNRKSGVLMIQGEKLYAQTNVSVMLKGLTIPVMMTMLVGQHDWDYLDYIRVNQNQPVGKNPIYSGVQQAPNYLISLLNGVPPAGAVALESTSDNVKAWVYGDKYLVLTTGTLMSPAWGSRVNGPGVDAYHAYTIPQAPMILVSYHGQLERVSLTQPPAKYGINDGDLGQLTGAVAQGTAMMPNGATGHSVRVKNVNAPKTQPAAAPTSSDTSGALSSGTEAASNDSLSNRVQQAKALLGGSDV